MAKTRYFRQFPERRRTTHPGQIFLVQFSTSRQYIPKKEFCAFWSHHYRLVARMPVDSHNLIADQLCRSWGHSVFLADKDDHLQYEMQQELKGIFIMKTCLYNFDPLKPHFYIVKLGFTGVYIICLISAQKHRMWVLVRTASPRRF